MSTRRGKKTSDSQDFDPTPSLGKTIQRLRKAYNMSLGDLSEQSGVAKSIISQIERNETNPTLSTVYRLSRALDTTIDEVLRTDDQQLFLEHQLKSGVPILESQDGLCRLAIAGPLNLVEQVQWYDFRALAASAVFQRQHQARLFGRATEAVQFHAERPVPAAQRRSAALDKGEARVPQQ